MRWLALILATAMGLGLYTNCQKAPSNSDSTPKRSTANVPPDDEDGIVHTFGSTGKVEINSSSLIQSPNALTKARRAGRFMKASATNTAVAAGTPLMVLLDRLCPRTPSSLSTLTLKETSTAEVADLRLHAFRITLQEDMLMEELALEADADPCVLQVANDAKIALHPIESASAPIQASAITNDPSFSQLDHLSSIQATAGWSTFFSPGLGITKDAIVAVIDTGIDYRHPDLAANIWTANNGTHGIDFVNNDDDPMDDNKHGTHVAGLIGAVANNGVGVTGVAGNHVKIMAVKILDREGSGTESGLVNGLRWAADAGADVMNLSMELNGSSTAVRSALSYAAAKGAVIAVAAGNSTKEITATQFVAPAGYCPSIAGAISVGSVDTKNGSLSGFSNFSSTYVMIAAPGAKDSVTGEGVLSTVPNNLYQRLQGTSMATPIVAGAAALVVGILKSNNIRVLNTDVVDLLQSSALTNTALATKIKNSASLNLERLSRAVRWRYMIDDDGGTEAIQ